MNENDVNELISHLSVYIHSFSSSLTSPTSTLDVFLNVSNLRKMLYGVLLGKVEEEKPIEKKKRATNDSNL